MTMMMIVIKMMMVNYFVVLRTLLRTLVMSNPNTSYWTKNKVFHWRFFQQMWPNPLETADLVTFTEEILNGKLYFLSSFHRMEACVTTNITSQCSTTCQGNFKILILIGNRNIQCKPILYRKNGLWTRLYVKTLDQHCLFELQVVMRVVRMAIKLLSPDFFRWNILIDFQRKMCTQLFLRSFAQKCKIQ